MTSTLIATTPTAAMPEHVYNESHTPVLSVQGLTKKFTDVLASDNLTLDFYAGEVHAVLGENGAGKSTLMKMLYGFYKPDAGEIRLRGERTIFRSPADARRRGIGMVFQSFTLIPALTVLENVALLTQTKGIRLDVSGLTKRIAGLSARYGLDVSPSAYVRDLSIGEQQRVEILKALACDPSILILDEPTSVLAPHEVTALLDIVRSLRDDGFAVLLITHKLGEVFACANRVSVLRRGQLTGTGIIDDFDQKSLLTLMLGERAADESDPFSSESRHHIGEGFALERVSLKAADGRIVLRSVDVSVLRGELVGVAAVSGNGRPSSAMRYLAPAMCWRARSFSATRKCRVSARPSVCRAGWSLCRKTRYATALYPKWRYARTSASRAAAGRARVGCYGRRRSSSAPCR